MTLAIGSLLQNCRYQIKDISEATDVEITYQATHTHLQRSVVLKQLRQDVDWSTPAKPTGEMLLQQLAHLAQCYHPCLMEILDCFEENDQVYLVLPEMVTPTLADWLQIYGPVSLDRALGYVEPLVNVIEQLHGQGLVYGELTPAAIHSCTKTDRLQLTGISWRMALGKMLGDRHRYPTSLVGQTQGLATITYSLLTGQTYPPAALTSTDEQLRSTNRSQQTNIALKYLLKTLLTPTEVLTESPSGWFLQLQAAVVTPLPVSLPTLGKQNSDNSKSALEQAEDCPTENTNNDLVHVFTRTEAKETPSSNKGGNSPRQRGHWGPRRKWLPHLLGATSLVAALSGGGLGYFFRTQDIDQLDQSPVFGNELFSSDQAFPPSDYWPGLQTAVDTNDSVLFEELPEEPKAQPVVQTNRGTISSKTVPEKSIEQVTPKSSAVLDTSDTLGSEDDTPELELTNDGGQQPPLLSPPGQPEKTPSPDPVPDESPLVEPIVPEQAPPVLPIEEPRTPAQPQENPPVVPRVDELPPVLPPSSSAPESQSGNSRRRSTTSPSLQPETLITPILPAPAQPSDVPRPAPLDSTDLSNGITERRIATQS